MHAYETYMYAVVGGMAAMTQKRVMKLEKKKKFEINKKEKSFAFSHKTLLSTTWNGKP